MKYGLFLASLFITVASVHAQDKTSLRQAQYNLSSSKLALSGYDPVSYFFGKPQKGKEAFTLNYSGVNYSFATAANRDAFQKSPSTYEPQYGGWCAYAMGTDGSKVDVDPETYKILNGKLYLFYNSFFNNTLKSWNKNEAALMKSADASWTKFYH